MKSYDIPIIKPFIHENKFYVYDMSKNKILSISENHFKEIHILQDIGINNYEHLEYKNKAYQDILSLLKCGFFSGPTIKNIVHSADNILEFLINRYMKDLILQVTEDCNFKCRYCLYSIENGIERNHCNVYMNWDIAKKSIDYLYQHSKDANVITIGFYGGEPLLCFKLIKQAVEYACTLFSLKKVEFLITTNGSLLTDQVIDFLENHKFLLNISLDGSEELQNKNRRFLYNGAKTFTTVYNNIQRLMKNKPQYFESYVRFSPVVFDDDNIRETFEYFSNLGIPKEKVSFNRVNLDGVDYVTKTLIDNTDVISISKDNKKFDPNENESYIEFKKVIMENSTIPPSWHHSGQCIPSVRRLFVTTTGKLLPCEKILESDAFQMGNINNGGVQIEKVRTLLNVGKLTEEECKKCWAIRFCSMCITHCVEPVKRCLSPQLKKSECELQKEGTLNNIKKFIDEQR